MLPLFTKVMPKYIWNWEAANERKLQVKSAIELQKQKPQQKRNRIAELDENSIHIEEQAAAV